MVVIQQSLATKFSTLQFFGVAVDRKSCSVNKSFDSTIYIMMLTETRDMLSLALYLADATSCTTHMIVQDGLDLTTQGLEKKAVLASLTGFVVSSSNIVL